MAGDTDPLALDGTPLMPATTAAIWYASDGFDPTKKGINGRRVAGESFLRGFFAHGDVTEFVSLAHTQADHAAFADLAHGMGVTRPLRAVRHGNQRRGSTGQHSGQDQTKQQSARLRHADRTA